MERFSVESYVGGYHVYKARTPLREVLAQFFGRASALTCSLLCSLPPTSHAGQPEKGDPTDHRHCQEGQVVKKSRTLARVTELAVYVWVENFVTLGLTTKITTPRKYPAIRY